MRVTILPDGREAVLYAVADRKLCPACNTFAVVPLTPTQLAAQPDNTTHVCHPAFDGCNQGYGPTTGEAESLESLAARNVREGAF